VAQTDQFIILFLEFNQMINEWLRKFDWWFAFILPKRIALYAFVRVFALSGDAPCSCGYKKHYDLWVNKYGIKKH
jgi:hypothetical protein